jgi:50S ribosomal protein L16 3-hydroxylase
MKTNVPLVLLGGLTPEQFMKQYWQKKPLLIRQAVPHMMPLLSRAQLFDMAARDEVQSRLIQRKKDKWFMAHGPLARRSLPTLKTDDWTVLLQSVDQHHAGARALMDQFRFIPDARLDDLMISYATHGGGVGPHFDSYDVFLLQVQGTRRWRIGRQSDLRLKEGLPLKILASFEPEATYDLEPGDMLYLPPRYAHDGVAVGECMTYSVGFRAPGESELAGQLMARMADAPSERTRPPKAFSDRSRPATSTPALLPPDMLAFAEGAIAKALSDKKALRRALGEYLTEPAASSWFDQGQWPAQPEGVRLALKTKMIYFEQDVFINGDSLVGSGRDLTLMQRLANQRYLSVNDLKNASTDVKNTLQDWCELGWVEADA